MWKGRYCFALFPAWSMLIGIFVAGPMLRLALPYELNLPLTASSYLQVSDPLPVFPQFAKYSRMKQNPAQFCSFPQIPAGARKTLLIPAKSRRILRTPTISSRFLRSLAESSRLIQNPGGSYRLFADSRSMLQNPAESHRI